MDSPALKMQAASPDILPNSVFKRSFTSNNLPSTLEPVSFTGDGKRPDGLTLGPWYKGLSLEWYATVVDTFAQRHYKNGDIQAGIATTEAEAPKC